MSRRRGAALAILAALAGVAALLPAPAQASPQAAWTMSLSPMPSALAPGGAGEYVGVATNVGAAPTSGEVRLQLALPVGITATAASANNDDPSSEQPECEFTAQLASCKTTQALEPGNWLLLKVKVTATGPEGPYEARAEAQGGGASQAASAPTTTLISKAPAPFGILPGFYAPLSEEDGTPSLLAGAHPYQGTLSFNLPTRNPGETILTNSGHPRNIELELPRGLLGDPAATQVLCTEAELITDPSCSKESQIGVVDVTTTIGAVGANGVVTSPLFNMVPPPGYPAMLGFNVAGIGIFTHVLAGVRSDSDYGVSASVRDTLAFGQQPIFGVQTQLWGDPTDPVHRLGLKYEGKTPFLTTPGECPGKPLGYEVKADSWEETGVFRKATYESADLAGEAKSLEGCGALQFEPSIEARPDTANAESPTGLRFTLDQPQQRAHLDPLTGRATAILKDTAIAFPPGLQVNPSQAAGLGACTEEQIGYTGNSPAGAPRFSKDRAGCPDEAKLGTVTAKTPLLAQHGETNEVQLDAEGNPIAEALQGSVYLATPYANPFGSLIAVYLTVEDPERGIVAKLAGEGRLDPATGQIATTFKESPELPLEEVTVHLFGGDRGALITPAACGEHETVATLTPWSAPEAAAAQAKDTFAVERSPSGGPCPAAQPNDPSLQAGTMSPAAGKYGTLIFKLSREDGSERLGSLEATLPAGLSAKLAGVAECPAAGIAQAISREAPNRGAEELADPSCPASSKLGEVQAAAGAGPHPYRISGHAYLAGPYEGAPLSILTIVPALAGPFDLGTVVVRAAVYIDPASARARAVSDPLPQIIDGVPADVRQVRLTLDRPSFALNPTSCDEEAFEGTATSALGHPAPLFERFKVDGCSALPFKPKLYLRLFGKTRRGAHPRLRAVLKARSGEANIARTVVALPHSEFIDQAHFRTICTRVQFAAHACPRGSIYGHMKAFSPLLDHPLEGPIYLRSSSHELPDVVADLHGPPSQPIELELDGRVDSVHGGVRTTFAAVPDAPVSKAIITMQGKRKGLFQNSTNICKGAYRATVKMNAHNGKTHDSRPPLRAQCGTHKKRKGHGKHRRSTKKSVRTLP